MGGDLVTRHALLPAAPSSAAEGRRLIRETLADAGRDDLIETSELVGSELITNALLHAATPVDLTATAGPDGLRLEVGDGSAQLPVERDYAVLSGTGRGLALVHRLAHAWGVQPTAAGKVVWVEVTTADEADVLMDDALLAELAELVELEEPDEVPVVLRELPVLMHSAWHEYAEALLRDYALAHLDVDPDPGAFRESSTMGRTAGEVLASHARAGEAMTLLRGQLPACTLPTVPADLDAAADVPPLEELFADCIEPAATLTEAVLRVPARLVDCFRALDEAMEAALAMADDGHLLAMAPPPEMRELRRWFCSQVDIQNRGGDPTPWRTPEASVVVLDPDASSPAGADLDRSTRAVVAADELNRIIAVSRPALDLLGYRRPDELIGQRLLQIIPARFHQAHLAGFTLHLTAGRQPLVATTTNVPFVCADGTERPLDMHLEVVSLADGHRMFVATLDT